MLSLIGNRLADYLLTEREEVPMPSAKRQRQRGSSCPWREADGDAGRGARYRSEAYVAAMRAVRIWLPHRQAHVRLGVRQLHP
jgi:hypothetical protein